MAYSFLNILEFKFKPFAHKLDGERLDFFDEAKSSNFLVTSLRFDAKV